MHSCCYHNCCALVSSCQLCKGYVDESVEMWRKNNCIRHLSTRACNSEQGLGLATCHSSLGDARVVVQLTLLFGLVR